MCETRRELPVLIRPESISSSWSEGHRIAPKRLAITELLDIGPAAASAVISRCCLGAGKRFLLWEMVDRSGMDLRRPPGDRWRRLIGVGR